MHVLKLEDLYIHLFNSDSSQKATPSYIKDSIGYEEDKLRVLMLTSHPFLNDVVDTLFSSVESEPKFQACVELMDIISREMPKFTITNNLASTM